MTEEALSSYRYERKFFITASTNHQVEQILKLHSAMFSEIYHERCVNNIYFDTHQLKNYFENIEGETNRAKVRVRWYGSLFGVIKNPILEVKVKKGLLGRKYSSNFDQFSLNKELDFSKFKKPKGIFIDSKFLDLGSLYPSLLNRYSRKYFLSSDGHYRATIDYDQSFYNLFEKTKAYRLPKKDKNSVILELKYAHDKDTVANNIISKLPFRVTKSSKYVTGMQKTLITI